MKSMKIKNDFVTNSSSVSFIVYIPKKFDITKYLTMKERMGIEEYDIDVDNLIRLIDLFQKNPVLTEYDICDIHKLENEYNFLIHQIFRELDMIVEIIDDVQEGDGMCVNIQPFFNSKQIQFIEREYGKSE